MPHSGYVNRGLNGVEIRSGQGKRKAKTRNVRRWIDLFCRASVRGQAGQSCRTRVTWLRFPNNKTGLQRVVDADTRTRERMREDLEHDTRTKREESLLCRVGTPFFSTAPWTHTLLEKIQVAESFFKLPHPPRGSRRGRQERNLVSPRPRCPRALAQTQRRQIRRAPRRRRPTGC